MPDLLTERSARVAAARKLTRRTGRDAAGLFLAEGRQAVGEALRAIRPASARSSPPRPPRPRTASCWPATPVPVRAGHREGRGGAVGDGHAAGPGRRLRAARRRRRPAGRATRRGWRSRCPSWPTPATPARCCGRRTPAVPGPSCSAPARPTRTTARSCGRARAASSTSTSSAARPWSRWSPRCRPPGVTVLAADGGGEVALDELTDRARRPGAVAVRQRGARGARRAGRRWPTPGCASRCAAGRRASTCPPPPRSASTRPSSPRAERPALGPDGPCHDGAGLGRCSTSRRGSDVAAEQAASAGRAPSAPVGRRRAAGPRRVRCPGRRPSAPRPRLQLRRCAQTSG